MTEYYAFFALTQDRFGGRTSRRTPVRVPCVHLRPFLSAATRQQFALDALSLGAIQVTQ